MGQITAVAPVLAVSSLARAIPFYRDMLGFEVELETNHPVGYAVVVRDDAKIHLVEEVERVGKSSVFLTVDDAEDFYQELLHRGVQIPNPVAERPYGLKDFYLTDCCGNALGFGSGKVQIPEL